MLKRVFVGQILLQKNALIIGVGSLSFVFVSTIFILRGISPSIAFEIASVAAIGAGAFTMFIDDYLGVSVLLKAREENRLFQNTDDDLRKGRINYKQALRIVVRRNKLKELREISWFEFFERRRVERSTNDLNSFIESEMPLFLQHINIELSLDQLCIVLYRIEELVEIQGIELTRKQLHDGEMSVFLLRGRD